MNSAIVKYPRTYHFEFSPGKTSDDKVQFDLSNFNGKDIVITEKMDGENANLTRDRYYARSLDSKNHQSRDYIKAMWGALHYNIPSDFRICGENLFAQHSIGYRNLEDYFLCFSIWQNNTCLSWDETLDYCQLLNLKTVPILWEGKFDLEFLKNFKVNTAIQEGFVVRLRESFQLEDFGKSVVKWVRENHNKTSSNWALKEIVENKLISLDIA